MKTRSTLSVISMLLALISNAQHTEGFETGYADGATTFTAPSGETFNLTSDLRIYNFETFGATTSDWFIDTGFMEGNTNTPPSQIQLVDAGKSFLLHSFYCWTSIDDGNSDASGTITLAATGPGGMASQDFVITPTGSSGADWQQRTTAGTDLDGFEIQTLTLTYNAPLNYVALDEIEYEVMDVVGIESHDWARSLKVYPNPATEVLNVEFDMEQGDLDYQVFDLLGAEVFSAKFVGTGIQALDISSIESGVYFIVLTNDMETMTKRFVKK